MTDSFKDSQSISTSNDPWPPSIFRSSSQTLWYIQFSQLYSVFFSWHILQHVQEILTTFIPCTLNCTVVVFLFRQVWLIQSSNCWSGILPLLSLSIYISLDESSLAGECHLSHLELRARWAATTDILKELCRHTVCPRSTALPFSQGSQPLQIKTAQTKPCHLETSSMPSQGEAPHSVRW